MIQNPHTPTLSPQYFKLWRKWLSNEHEIESFVHLWSYNVPLLYFSHFLVCLYFLYTICFGSTSNSEIFNEGAKQEMFKWHTGCKQKTWHFKGNIKLLTINFSPTNVLIIPYEVLGYNQYYLLRRNFHFCKWIFQDTWYCLATTS